MTETEFSAWVGEVAERKKYLSDEQIFAIRAAIKYGDGWDGDQWDLALAHAIEQEVMRQYG